LQELTKIEQLKTRKMLPGLSLSFEVQIVGDFNIHVDTCGIGI